MRENDLGRELSKELTARGWKVFKLHNDAFQRGLPDYVMWRKHRAVALLELKVASSLDAAVKSLSPGQRSVIESISWSAKGVTIVYAGEIDVGVVAGYGMFTEGNLELPVAAYVAGGLSLKEACGNLAIRMTEVL